MLDQYVVPRVAGILSHKEKIMLDLLILDNQIPFFVIEELFMELHLKKLLYEYALEFFKTIHPRSTQVPENKDNELRLDDVFWEYYMPTAMKLRKSATVLFEKNISGTALDITFRKRRLITTVGVINIPHLHIHEYSSRIFHNLIAFEMQRPSSDRRTMAFSVIMQNLLQSEEDVKLLRRRGILANTCMTDYKIVNFFKSLRLLIKNDDMPIDVYAFCRQVLSYHKGRMSRFYANAIFKYLPNW
uniref:Uncharacterized protein n=1 Tax=Ananas comosus var. bracteatus TaxID=296719 RepID=A0A6V7P108_ANACO|nr:unnamed protein product [Ananas comosus var. bracteatus]